MEKVYWPLCGQMTAYARAIGASVGETTSPKRITRDTERIISTHQNCAVISDVSATACPTAEKDRKHEIQLKYLMIHITFMF